MPVFSLDQSDSAITYASDRALTLSPLEAWASLGAIVGMCLATLAGFGGVVWFASLGA